MPYMEHMGVVILHQHPHEIGMFESPQVAPILGPGVSVPMRQTYDFWVIGSYSRMVLYGN